MEHINIEIKARCSDTNKVRAVLKSINPYSDRLEKQVDTYFKVNKGRLKLREGNRGCYLIYYERSDIEGPKKSKVVLYPTYYDSRISEFLFAALDILIVVTKIREIYFIDNIRFHIYSVHELGDFIEIEAIDKKGDFGELTLMQQCNHYINLLGIHQEDLVSVSYSDLLLRNKQ